MRFLSKEQLKGEKKIFERPLMQRMTAGEEVSMKEIRDFLLAFLVEHETHTLCSNCPEHRGLRSKTACCEGCPLHDMGVGCTLRNSGCLTWTCEALRRHLEKRDGLEEIRVLGRIFGYLDTLRGERRIPDHVMIRLKEYRWGAGGFQAEPVDGASREFQEETWTYEDSREAYKRHRELTDELG